MSAPTTDQTTTPAAPCGSCGTTGGWVRSGDRRPSRTRGLCTTCYGRANYHGTLPQEWERYEHDELPVLAGTAAHAPLHDERPWRLTAPLPLHNSRPLAVQILRTYPNRAEPVRLESSEAYQWSCACTEIARQTREDDAA